MVKKLYNHVVSIDDCIEAAEELRREAAMVTTRDSHAVWWDNKVEVLNIVNSALSTGYWIGDLYDKLWVAKNILIDGERIAGNKALNYLESIGE